jgi:hypothetical protein
VICHPAEQQSAQKQAREKRGDEACEAHAEKAGRRREDTALVKYRCDIRGEKEIIELEASPQRQQEN